MSSTKEFIVAILHEHGSEFGTTIGKIKASDKDEALQKSELWVARKRRDHKCKSFGNNCSVYVRQAYTGQNSTMLACSAEDINKSGVNT